MNINQILIDSTRSIYSVEDKLSIATIFIFCNKVNRAVFAELLYTKDHEVFIKKLNDDYKEYEVDFSIRLHDRNVKECFYKTISKVIEKYDDDGFLKALYNKDDFAVMINKISSCDFSKIQKKIYEG